MELSSHQYRRGTATQLLNIALGVDRQPVLELLGYGVPQNDKLKAYCKALFSADELSPLFFSGFNLLGAVLIATGMTPFGIQSEDDPSYPDGFGWLAGSYVTGFIDDDRPDNYDEPPISATEILNNLMDLDRDAIANLTNFEAPCSKRLLDDPFIVCHPTTPDPTVSIMGLLNGILAAAGAPKVARVLDNETGLLRFVEWPVKTDCRPAPLSSSSPHPSPQRP